MANLRRRGIWGMVRAVLVGLGGFLLLVGFVTGLRIYRALLQGSGLDGDLIGAGHSAGIYHHYTVSVWGMYHQPFVLAGIGAVSLALAFGLPFLTDRGQGRTLV